MKTFDLTGSARKNRRHSVKRLESVGAAFEVYDGPLTDALLSELQAVSDTWLTAKKQVEKGFSLGRFEREYLDGWPLALVRIEGRMVAFANVWTMPGKQELSIDLMRHLPDAPNGLMDFLFVRLMQWGREQGYARFNLGVAPLSGIESRRLAPIWARAAGLLYRHGERVYGYEGLHRYKEKFRPEWHGRYLAAPRGLAMAKALIDVTRLVSRPPPRSNASPGKQAQPKRLRRLARARSVSRANGCNM